MSTGTAGQAISGILSTTGAVTNLVGTRIDPQFSPGGTYPRIVFDIEDQDEFQSHDGPAGVIVATVAIHCMARTKAGAVAVAAAVKTPLDGAKNQTWGGVTVPYCKFIPPAQEEFLSAVDTGEQDQVVAIINRYAMWFLSQ